MDDPASDHDVKQMTSSQGDFIMWGCIALALLVTIALPLMMS